MLFFKNQESKNNLIDKLFQVVKSDHQLEKEFRQYLGKREIYKAIKDIVENSQNILVVIDEYKQEFDEVMDTYTDTWDKMVKIIVLKKYVSSNNINILTLEPDFQEIGFVEPFKEETEGRYTEGFHLEGVEENIKSIYEEIKEKILAIDDGIKVNPQKYYISLRKRRNFAFLKIKKKKLHIVIMLPYERGKEIIKKHKITELSKSIQSFYNGPCFKVTIANSANLDEIIKALEEAYLQQK